MNIKVSQPTDDELEKLGVKNWPIWESPITTFPWEYDSTEVCYFLKGQVIVETADGKSVEIKKGDLVRFPKGLKCTWKVLQAVKKHYTFE